MTVVLCAPLRLEAAALRRGLPPGWRHLVVRTGYGAARSARAAAGAAVACADAVLVAGIAGGLDPALRPGAVVVADRVIGPGGAEVRCPTAPMLAGRLRAGGIDARVGAIATSPRLVPSAGRAALARSGAVAVDMESAALVDGRRPFAVLRVIADPADGRLVAPATLGRVRRAVSALSAVAPALADWAAAVRRRTVLLAAGDDPDALRDVATGADVALIVGSERSGDDRRVAGAARRCGARTYLVGDIGDVDLLWLAGAGTVGIIAGASTPAARLDGVRSGIGGLGPIDVVTRRPITKNMHVTLTKEVSGA